MTAPMICDLMRSVKSSATAGSCRKRLTALAERPPTDMDGAISLSSTSSLCAKEGTNGPLANQLQMIEMDATFAILEL